MKVLLINGSPHKNGTTHAALEECRRAIEAEGVEAEIFWVGAEPIRGCMGCAVCAKGETGRCRFQDSVNACLDKIDGADGLIVGTPTHYAGASGAITAFMDRLCYRQENLRGMPAAAVAVARRGGAVTAFNQLTNYFSIMGMPMVPSCYWNIVYGLVPEDIRQDEEGLVIMRTLGRNMVWMLRCIEAGRQAGYDYPKGEGFVMTNFVR